MFGLKKAEVKDHFVVIVEISGAVTLEQVSKSVAIQTVLDNDNAAFFDNLDDARSYKNQQIRRR